MDEQQERTAKLVSAEFAHFWRAYHRRFDECPDVEDLTWAVEFYKKNAPNFKRLMELMTDES